MTTINAITLPERVSFDDPTWGPQRGKVLGVLPDISNGRSTAVIEVDHALPGVLHHVAVDELKPIEGEPA